MIFTDSISPIMFGQTSLVLLLAQLLLHANIMAWPQRMVFFTYLAVLGTQACQSISWTEFSTLNSLLYRILFQRPLLF